MASDPHSPLKTCYIHNVPTEVVTQFFRPYLDALGKRRVAKGLRTLCLTCKRWCDIAVSVPSFWASLDISISTTPSISLNTLDTFLKRSDRLPLTFSFTVQVAGAFIASGDPKIARAILQKLMMHLHRWYKVTLAFQLDKLPSFPNDATAHALESLDLQMDGGRRHQLRWIESLLAISPRLHAFADRASRWHSVYIQTLSLSKLRQLQLAYYLSPELALGILEQMPILDYCQLSLKESYTKASKVLPQVVCQARSMTINLTGGATFFTRLVAPNLTALELHPACPLEPIHQQSLQSFLTRTPGQITSFIIRNLFMSDEELLDHLRLLSPCLKKLIILTDPPSSLAGYQRVENFTERIITPLTYRGETSLDEFICPELEILGLERCVRAQDGLISNMVSSRRHRAVSTPYISNTAELHFFYIVLQNLGHSVDGERLEKLRREGLSGIIEFGYPRREWIENMCNNNI